MRLVAVSLICTTGQNLQVMLKSGKDSRSQRSAHKKEINNHFGLQAYRCLLVFMTVYYLVFIGNFQVYLLAEVLHTGPGLPWCPAVPGSLQGHVPVDLNNRSWSDLHRSLAQAQSISFIWWGTSLHFIEIGDQRITQVQMEWNDTCLSMRSRQEVTTHPPPVSKQRKGQLCSMTSWQTQTFFFHLHFYKNWFLFEWEELPHVTQWPYLCPSEIGTVISEYFFTTFILFWSDRTWITGDNVRQWTNLSIVFRIFVIQQKDNETFNRAMLLNVGYTEAIKVADWDCLGKFISTADLKSFHMAWTQVFPLSLNNFLN